MNRVAMRLTPVEHCSGVSFTASPGDIVGIVGGSESARSALLLALVGLRPVERGWVSIDGEPLLPQTAAYYRRFISYVPRSLDFGKATVGDIVGECLRLSVNAGRTVSGRDVEEDLRLLSLPDGVMDKPFAVLSRGDVQRVAIAMAGAFGRPLLVLDDPSSLQDDEGRLALMSYLCSAKMRQVSVVVSTADQAILSVCNRKIKLNVKE